MKPGRSLLLALLRLLAISACLGSGMAVADEYSEVGQMLRAGRLTEAQTRVDRALAAKPRDPQMRYFKGVIQRESGQSAEALATFTKLTEDYPELPEPYNSLAVIHAAQGEFDKARVALEMAIRANPGYATAHENLGDIHARLAQQAYCKALQLDATNSSVRSRLAALGASCP
ncbi:MAG: tetratricopeptide repeat protein [Burkholderiales bacterium]|nr:tetratricopeptide repeat protein [Burkholderiales bacterium]